MRRLKVFGVFDTESIADLARPLAPPEMVDVGFSAMYGVGTAPAVIDRLVGAAGQWMSHFEFTQGLQGWDLPFPSGASSLCFHAPRGQRLTYRRTAQRSGYATLRSVVATIPVVELHHDAPLVHWAHVVNMLARPPLHVARVRLVTRVFTPPAPHVRRRLERALDWPRLEHALAHCAGLERVEVVLRSEDGLREDGVAGGEGRLFAERAESAHVGSVRGSCSL